MNRNYLIIGGVVAVIFLLAGLGILGYAISQGGSLPGVRPTATPTPAIAFDVPNLKITPPPSLDSVAAEVRKDYPQLADLLENPELGTVYKDFYLAYQQGGPEAAKALARQRGILNDKEQIIITLVLDTEDSAALQKELEAEGVIIVASYGNQVNIAIPLALIEEQIKAENPDLILTRISDLEHVIRLELPNRAGPKQQGATEGQGVNVTQANKWHEQGITGQGVKVGVLDLGFGGYKNLLGTELPANVTVKAFGDPYNFDEEVHGTACAEIVHEMAPDAKLYLAYYDGSDAAMGEAVDWLMSQNVDIITNSTGSNGTTPMDGTGFAADLVNKAHDAGIFWVNAAGNEADVHWRGQFNDTDGNNIHEFSPDNELLPFMASADYPVQIVLSWDDWQNVDQDYDLILTTRDGDILATSEETQDGQQSGREPIEGFNYQFDEEGVYALAIQNYEGSARGDATFDIFINGGLMHPDFTMPERSLSSPSDAQGAFAVGAVNWADDVLEPYSSQGPTADGRMKPDLTAPSVVDSASYAPEAFNGTSAATPHVAGALALILQAFPNFTPADLTQFLDDRAKDLGDPGPDNQFGVGRLNLGDAPVVAPQPEATPAQTDVEPVVIETEEAALVEATEPSATVETPPTEIVEATPTEVVEAVEVTPTAVAQLRPTSTPRPPEAVVGLPGRTGLPGSTGLPVSSDTGQPAASSNENNTLGLIILLGLCMVCLGGMLFLGLIMVGLVMMFRKK
jgi:subtilisin family serine protease